MDASIVDVIVQLVGAGLQVAKTAVAKPIRPEPLAPLLQFPARDQAVAALPGAELVSAHDDGDLTVRSRGREYVVTTQGKVYGEAQAPPAGGPIPDGIPHARPEPASPFEVTQAEYRAYQDSELEKKLLALESHLAQGCIVAGKPCDCCSKHAKEIEELAQETVRMGGDDLYSRVAELARHVQSLTWDGPTVVANASTLGPLSASVRAVRKRVGVRVAAATAARRVVSGEISRDQALRELVASTGPAEGG